MKKKAILLCPTIADELELCLSQGSVTCDVHVLTNNNHNLPDKLRVSLQEEIDHLQDYDQILLTFGICGNATMGLCSRHAELVIPRVDDCVSLLMNGVQNRMDSLNGKFGMFLTAGWLRYEEGIWGEIQHCLKRYPPGRAEKIIAKMYENLTYLTLLDTGAYDIDAVLPRVEELADQLHLILRILPGDLTYLRELIHGGENPDRFVHIPPGVPVTQKLLNIHQISDNE